MSLFRKNLDAKTDEELMLLLTKGGQLAFDELYKRYAKLMLNFFFRMLNNDRAKAEDHLHDLFLKIVEKPESFDGTKNFRSWFYALAGNMIKNEYRRMQVRQGYEMNIIRLMPDSVEQSIENMDKEQFEYQLRKELEKMDVEMRMLFNLRFVQEMNVKEIAEIMECPEGTVKSRIFYLTKQLSKKLMKYKPELN